MFSRASTRAGTSCWRAARCRAASLTRRTRCASRSSTATPTGCARTSASTERFRGGLGATGVPPLWALSPARPTEGVITMIRTLDIYQPGDQPPGSYSRHDGRPQYGNNLPVPVGEVLEGELVSPGVVHDLCGEYHVLEPDGSIFCCGCGHVHDTEGPCLPSGPCGDSRCCVN